MSPPPNSLGERGLGFYEHRIYAVIYCSHILALRKEAKKCEGANTEGLSNWTVIRSETGCIKANMDASPTLHITYPSEITSSTSPEWWGGHKKREEGDV